MKTIKEKEITARVQSFEDACRELNIQSVLPDCTGLPEKHRKSAEAHYKLVIIAEALNEGWTPDFNNWDQRKWFNWGWFSNAGLFNLSVYYSSADRYANVGARLCFKTEELSEYAGRQFYELYKEYLLY